VHNRRDTSGGTSGASVHDCHFGGTADPFCSQRGWDKMMSCDTTFDRDAACLPPGVSDLSKLCFWLPPTVSGVPIEASVAVPAAGLT
jgi:hypothetical protein